MNRLLLVSFASVAALMLSGGGNASAQYNPYYPYPTVPRPAGGYNSYGQPPISPYLNLIPNNRLPVNYFLGALPEFDRRANAARFSSAIYDLDQRMSMPPRSDMLSPTLNETGHPAFFGNYGTYYYMQQHGRPAQTGSHMGTPPRTR